MKHLLAAVLGTAIMVSAAMAQPLAVKLTADEIAGVLTGNTAVGTWDRVGYHQYFGDDGVTLFAQEGIRTARGEWRVDAVEDEYQSLWPGDAEWEGWFIMQWEGTYYWVSRTTPPTPFEVLEGQQLVAE